ncbi:RsmB/NOP family class I SAM-dependent RNA methyltransferase [Paracoccus sp. (in: a-proteobacteria)]|uniref:RsmB/NOP family class I SAM-dependent RNA methyltransferase n=1 Tax=Paracoccus sp. TaxID=267 RepID=UPI003A8B9D12
MTPAAHVATAIGILDQVLQGAPAEQALLRWSRASRFAGSGDRAAVRDLVFQALRRRNSLASLGGALSGRGLMIGLSRDNGQDPDTVFTGEGYAPAPLTPAERVPGTGTVPDIPDWIVPLWRASLGAEADRIADAMRDRAPVWLRVNALRGDTAEAVAMLATDGIEVQPSPQLATALRVSRGERRVNASRAYREGLVELQDLSPQLACAALPLAEGDRVLDYCAGGGGKSLALAAQQPRLRLFAHDADPSRMSDLPVRARRAGARIDPVSRPQGHYQLVIADVPCSGTGTWRRTPDAKWRFDAAALDRLLTIQARILSQVAPLVAPDGYLCYMTCSFLRPENDARISDFLAENPSFSQVQRHLWTSLSASDGFFLSVLKNNPKL